MPRYEDIPAEFKSDTNPWVEWQSQWFYAGLPAFPQAREGINRNDAQRHLGAIQRSFEPKHEHKMAAVAYLASLWLQKP